MPDLGIGSYLSDLFRTDKPEWLVGLEPDDRAGILFLAFSYSAWWLATAVILQFALGTAHKVQLYILFVVLTPTSVIAAVLLIQRLKHSLGLPPGAAFYEPLLTFNGFFILFSVQTLLLVDYTIGLTLAYILTFVMANVFILFRLTRIYRLSLPLDSQHHAVRVALVSASAGVVAVLGVIYLFGNLAIRPWYVDASLVIPAAALLFIALPVLLYRYAYRVLPVVAMLVMALFVRKYLVHVLFLLPISALVAIAPALLIKPKSGEETRASFSWPEWLVVVGLALIVVNLYFPSDRLHYNAFLAHVNDVVHGKTLLVDTHPQYGTGLTYFLSALFGVGFMQVGYSAFSLINSVLLVIQFSLLYFMLRTLVNSRWVAALTVIMMVALNLWQVNFILLDLPSGGPIRFLPIYIMLAAVALRLKHPGRWTSILEYLSLALCAGWSLETLIYGIAVYMSIRVFEILIERLPLMQSLSRAARLIPPILAALVLPLAMLEIGTFLRSGSWPDWRVYSDMLHYFSVDAKPYQQAIIFWSDWIVVLSICGGSLILLGLRYFYQIDKKKVKLYILPFGITVWGIVQFSFYIANPNVISNMVVPAVFLAAYWFSEMRSSASRPDFSAALSCVAYALIVFVLGNTIINVDLTRNWTPLALLARPLFIGAQSGNAVDIGARWNALPDTQFFRPPDSPKNVQGGVDAIRLIEHFAPSKDRVVVLISPDSSNEALLITHKVDVFPLGDVKDQSSSTVSNQRALEFHHQLTAGDVIFIDVNFSNLLPVQVEIIGRLCQQFSLHPLEASPSGVTAIQLQPHESTSGACICDEKKLSCP